MQAAKLKANQIETISPLLFDRISPKVVAALPVATIKGLTTAQVLALDPVQRRALSDEQRKALPAARERRVRQHRDAIRPGIRLLGDAYSQLAESAESGTSAQGAFGGGVEIETLTASDGAVRTALLVRKGTQPAVLTTGVEMGQALLNPQTESFFFGGEAAWWPKQLHRENTLFGLQGHVHVAQTEWQIELAPEDEASGVPAVDFSSDGNRSASVNG